MDEYINMYDFLRVSKDENGRDLINAVMLPTGAITNFIKNYLCLNIILMLKNIKIKSELKESNKWKSSIEHYKNKICHLLLITRLKKANLKTVINDLISKNFVTNNKILAFSGIKFGLISKEFETSGVRCVNLNNGFCSPENREKILDSDQKVVVNSFTEENKGIKVYNLDSNCQNDKGVHEPEDEIGKKAPEKDQKKRVKSVRFSNKIIFHYIN